MTKRLTEREEINKGFIRRMLKIENRAIYEIKNQRKAIIREFLAGNLEQEHYKIVERMYFDSDAECITGK